MLSLGIDKMAREEKWKVSKIGKGKYRKQNSEENNGIGVLKGLFCLCF